MDLRLRQFLAQVDADEVEVRRFTDEQHLVAPVVLVREGVLNGGYLPADEIARSAPGWDGVPVTVNHPSDNGDFVRANQPEFIESQTIGRIFNAEYDTDLRGIRGEAWIHANRAASLNEDAADIASALAAAADDADNADVLEVSTGYLHDARQQAGTHNGDDYEQIQFDILPDHLAILTDDPGACSVEDGCGVPRTGAAADATPGATDGPDATAASADQPDGTPVADGGTPGLFARAASTLDKLAVGTPPERTGACNCGETCDCGGETDESDATINTGDSPDDTPTMDYDEIAANTPFSVEALEQMTDEQVAQIATNDNGDDGDDPDGDPDGGADPDDGAGADADDDPADPDDDPDGGDGGDDDGTANSDEVAALRAELDELRESMNSDERAEYVKTITTNSSKTEDDLADQDLGTLREMADLVDETTAPTGGAGRAGSVNYAGRGAPAANAGGREGGRDGEGSLPPSIITANADEDDN